jgi:AcrR family transcriptional regulator
MVGRLMATLARRAASSSHRTPLRRDARDSQEKLILAAERLFAERGVEGVSLREINQAAGQKNASGLQYHFGTKADLLEAVFSYRVPEIEVSRAAMLERLKQGNGFTDLRQIVNAIVIPFAEMLDGGRDERCYVRFLAQLYSHPSIRKADLGSAGYRETFRAAQRLLSEKFPAPIVKQRLAMIIGHVIHALADLESRVAKQGRQMPPARIELFVSDLLDTVIGALTAPVSPSTAALLQRD